MKNLLVILLALAAGVALVACNGKRKDVPEKPKCLVLYYSQTGVTQQVAEAIQEAVGADMEALELVEPYNGTYEETIERSRSEREQNITPQIKPLRSDIKNYDIVFLGYPVWFGTYALPIASLLKEYADAFAGCEIIPFCTFGSGGLESSTADLRTVFPNNVIIEGYGVREARINAMPEELKRFLIENDFVEGTVEPLPEYSEMQPVGEEETALFNAACAGYKYPLGTPVSFGMRKTETRTDYIFSVVTFRPDGSETTGTIYISQAKEEGSVPEFTRVVR